MDTSLPPDEPHTLSSVETASKQPVAGQLVAERFRVGEPLGEGGMGVVVEAVHLFTGATVALKLVASGRQPRPQDASRLLLEARAIGRLRSPHIVQVLDAGPLPGGLAYIAMERLRGETLRERLTRESRLSISDALTVGQQMAEALIVAHAAGIIHRDLKPSNLFLVGEPGAPLHLKVLDFGIAKAPNGGEATTDSDAVFGSPGYMSPEQLRGTAAVDARTDLWSFGVTLYEALAGRRPFEAPSATGIALAIATESPPPLRSLRAEVPPELEALIHACLARSPEARPSSAQALLDRLTGPTAVTGVSGTIPPVSRRRRLPSGGLAALLAVGALALSAGLARRTVSLAAAPTPDVASLPAPRAEATPEVAESPAEAPSSAPAAALLSASTPPAPPLPSAPVRATTWAPPASSATVSPRAAQSAAAAATVAATVTSAPSPGSRAAPLPRLRD